MNHPNPNSHPNPHPWRSHLSDTCTPVAVFAQDAYVSEQYVRNHFKGLYSLPSDRLLTQLSELTTTPVAELSQEYFQFQRSIRRSNSALFKNNFEALKPVMPVYHKDFRLSLFDTMLDFCRALCVNPINVDNYEKTTGKALPLWLLKAYTDCSCVKPSVLKGFFK